MNFGDVPTLTEQGILEWVSNTPYYPRNLIAFVIRNGLPEALGEGEIVAQTVRALIEMYSLEISGLNTAFSSTSKPTKTVAFKFAERYGRPIDSFFTWWYDKYQAAWAKGDIGDDGTIDVMFLEPDPTHTKVTHAIFMYRMRPTQYTGIESKRDLQMIHAPFPASTIEEEGLGWWRRFRNWIKTRGRHPVSKLAAATNEALRAGQLAQPTTLKVTFTGETSMGPGVIKFAQELLDQVVLSSSNPYVKPDPKVFGTLRRKALDVYQF